MPLLDDDVLGALLHELGDSYAVPDGGPSAVLRRVHRGDDEALAATGTADADGGLADGGLADDDGDGDERDELDLGPGYRLAPRGLGGIIRTHRLLSVAAFIVVLGMALAGVGALFGSLASGPGGHNAVKALRAAPTGVPHPAGSNTTTTVQGARAALSAGSSTAFGTNAPSHGAALGASAAAPAPGLQSKAVAGATGSDALPVGAVGQPAKIEQTGSVTLTVPKGDFSNAMTKLSTLATTYGGFVANSQTQARTSGQPPSGTVTLQIPVASFGAVLKAAEALGTPSALTTKATDVTGQYVDLQSRITALQASRQQYLTIMTKASSVGDVLAVQAQLDSLQSQIEQLQGQLAVLDSETSYSTLVVPVREAAPVHHHHHVVAPSESGAAKAWHDSVHGFATGVDGIIRIAGPTLFALLCLAVLILGGRLTWRRLQRHNL